MNSSERQNAAGQAAEERARSGQAPVMSLACVTSTGKIREHNEDNFNFFGEGMPAEHQSLDRVLTRTVPDGEPFAVAIFDGMGGEQAGELASYTAAHAFSRMRERGHFTVNGINLLMHSMNRAVLRRRKLGHYGTIGTTVTMLASENGIGYVANLGDSPAYLFRSGSLARISKEHTEREMLERLGIHQRKAGLTQFLGMDEEQFQMKPHVYPFEIIRGDIILLASDGLTDMVPENVIADVLSVEQTPARAAIGLRELALTNGGVDNITIMICRAQ